MPFCAQCGSQVSGAFCGNCGFRMGGPSAATPAPAPASGGGSAAKIILIVVGALAFLGMLGVAGLVFLGYKAKEKIEQVAKEEGIDLGEAARSKPSAKEIEDACALLSVDDVGAVLDVKIARAENAPNGCQYFPEGEPDRTGPLVHFTVTSGGSLAWAGIRLGTRMAEAAGKAGEIKDAKLTEPLEGLGDKAVALPGDISFIVLKGDYLITMTFPQVEGREKKMELARRVVSRL